jgi:ApbE superfamily uncharacterized protein (UPF0280 family)
VHKRDSMTASSHGAIGEQRTYRRQGMVKHLQSFQVTVQETDLMVQADQDLSVLCREEVLAQRGYIEQYIKQFPEFLRTLAPWTLSEPAPEIIRRMIHAGRAAGVGPMAAVAGAIAEAVGEALSLQSKEVVVENGGDIYLVLNRPVTIGLYAGQSPLSMRTGLHLDPGGKPLAVCTSSGTIGHSLSMGRADAVCVVARQGALADAAATAVANRITDARAIPEALRFSRSIDGVEGVAAICGERLGLWGDLRLVKLERRKKVEF